VVSLYSLILLEYKINSSRINHAIIKFFFNIEELGKSWLLYKLSTFRILNEIINNNNPKYEELKTFAIHMTRKLFEYFKKNPKRMVVELLFRQTSTTSIFSKNVIKKGKEKEKLVENEFIV